MPDKSVQVSRKPERARHGWVFSNEVRRSEGDPRTGDSVKVFDRGKFIGSGLYNANSLISVRLYSAGDEELGQELISSRLKVAYQYRTSALPHESDFRLCYGESDRLPGLVIDKYGKQFAVQAYSAGMDQRLGVIAGVLEQGFGAECVYEKNDFRLRGIEGLARKTGVLAGSPGPRAEIAEGGVRFAASIETGQKTGFYFDQRLTRQKFRELARGRKVLDVFSYSGGFAVNAALGGAEHVMAVDSSAPACELARANAALNGVAERCEVIAADAFEFLSGAKPGFDLICLDPPSFAKSARERMRGLRGFARLNTMAMRLLSKDGMLVTCSCSNHLSWQDLAQSLARAASDTGRDFVILDRLTQGPDHPVLLAMPETEYLRCFVLLVR